MTRLYVICEGDTEEFFVKHVVKPYLQKMNLHAIARPLGGFSKYSLVQDAILKTLSEDRAGWVTTLIDFYGLNKGFPGYEDALKLPVPQNAQLIEKEFAKSIDSGRFLPYIQLYEFEAILFSDTDIMTERLKMDNKRLHSKAFESILKEFETPEHINNDPNKKPSKRISDACLGNYRKSFDGVQIADLIGIEKIRKACPHFHDWISRLEKLDVSKK